MAKTHILGFPRIGANRELKKSLESYWSKEISKEKLISDGNDILHSNWKTQSDCGLDFVTVGDFSYYDHILDTSLLLGVVPSRFINQLRQVNNLDTIFDMARGTTTTAALSMTKWFNTNYHYIVPEFNQDQVFKISSNKLFNEIMDAKNLGYNVKPVLIGPMTYLWLGKGNSKFDKLSLLPNLIKAYNEILVNLQGMGVKYLQIDEPILTLELPEIWQKAFQEAYSSLDFHSIQIILTTYFDDLA